MKYELVEVLKNMEEENIKVFLSNLTGDGEKEVLQLLSYTDQLTQDRWLGVRHSIISPT